MSVSNNHSPHLDNLPVPLSTFIGRQQEITRVKELISEHHLVTLSGTGGCGKTRLGLRVASELRGAFRDGIWLTEFASIAEEDLVAGAVACTLGLREEAESPVGDSMMSYLKPRAALLIFDTCDRVVRAIERRGRPGLGRGARAQPPRTSREPLG